MNIAEVEVLYFHDCFYFRFNKLNVKNNLSVIVDTDKGLQYGVVKRIVSDVSSFHDVELGNIVRIASKRDYLNYLEGIKMANNAVIKCKEIVFKSGLNMTILDGVYNFDRTQLLFRFVADERVDFRNLARELGTTFRTRIELRQIGIRDKAKEIGGIGPCGRILCCSSFLRNFDSVTINMAKNQNVSLNPSKINGVCGRLLCCLKYENDIYSDNKRKLPKIGDVVKYRGKSGTVVSIDALNNSYILECSDKNMIEVVCDGKK